MGILRVLGKLGKGFATVGGLVLGVGGVSLGGTDTLHCVERVLSSGPDTLTALGLALVLFGVGRKAGFVAASPPQAAK